MDTTVSVAEYQRPSYRLTLANNFEVYGHANPFDGPESEWPELEPELEEQAALPE